MNRVLAPILLLTLLFPTFAIGETMDDLVERDGMREVDPGSWTLS